LEKKIFFYILGYGNEAKKTVLETALFYKDLPTLAKENSYPKTVVKVDEKGIQQILSEASPLQKIHGYKLRKDHVKKSQEVTFCTNLHIDFLQTPR